jgi:membrane-associated phospholipid phosphatase
MKSPPFLAWPGWRLFTEAVLLGLAVTAWWLFVYDGTDWVTGQRSVRFRVHFDAELRIPFVPAFLLIYRSIDPMFWLGPFVLRTRAEVRALVLALFVVIGFGGVCFLLLPAEVGYAPIRVEGFWAEPYRINDQIVRTYNLLPSLHVALSTLTLAAYGTRRGVCGRTLLALWGGLIALSTLLIHEHHVLDVITGALLGWLGYRWLYLRMLRTQVAQTAPANPSSGPEPKA